MKNISHAIFSQTEKHFVYFSGIQHSFVVLRMMAQGNMHLIISKIESAQSQEQSRFSVLFKAITK